MMEYTECPECGEEMTLRGLHGHLRMGHGLAGETLDRVYQEARDNSYKRRENSPVEKVQAKLSASGAEGDGQPANRQGSGELHDMVEKLNDRLDKMSERISKMDEPNQVAPNRVAPNDPAPDRVAPRDSEPDDVTLESKSPDEVAEEEEDLGSSLPPIPEAEYEEEEDEEDSSGQTLSALPEANKGDQGTSQSTFMADVRQKLDELVAARMRYQTALEATDPTPEGEEDSTESGGFGIGNGVISQMLSGEDRTEEESGPKRSPAAQKLVQECREEVERCEHQLAQSLDHADLEVQQPKE